MTRRLPSEEERALFEETFKDARALNKIAAKRATKPKVVAKPTLSAVRMTPAAPKPSGIDGNTERDLRKGMLDPDARLDLHGMSEAAAHRALATFLRGAQARGLRLLLVVTGKGKSEAPDEPFDMSGRKRGVLKAMTPRWLAEPAFAPFIADVRSAHRKHGGAGAFYVYLRKSAER
jgi:DNA-nicking Smr family endonuclease